MSELTIPERVAAGAAWLDQERPGWWERINIETLDLGDPCYCVLGQEYGWYDESPEAARWQGETPLAAGRGFIIFTFEQAPRDDSYAALTAEWRRLIESRRSGAVSS